MNIFIAKETHPGESRIPVIPATIEKFVKLGCNVSVESGIGASLGISDEIYAKAGSQIAGNVNESLASADIVIRLRKPSVASLDHLKPGAIHVSYLDPFNEHDLIRALASKSISAISLEMIPRTTIAQKMDVISSQANLGGYVAVILAAERSAKIFPMMTTPAGTIAPAKVFVIGVGVAGLQAIATAKRLGALVEAFDTRPVVEDQVKSLGAKFVKIDLGETGQTKDGYAKALTPEQIEIQRKAMAKHCAASDIVITTAQVFGRKAPVIVTREMVAGMAPGSIIVDMAVETGGNVEGSEVDKEVDVNGVRIIGLGNLPGRVAVHASQMYSSNAYNFVEHFWAKKEGRFNLRLEDEIIRGALITHGGEVVNPVIKELLQKGKDA
ncbi:MAG TPA: Re/Si-specific NAD(P)(+) transhydrogenase subunit alpha [Kiritimatiellia bacterium]|nr:Re/Si-specific NAD(P)(+) transhydrogenase subunit alpha [Kiritimatiellia bacterium]